jgi:imidazolonepropionase-like amidohydrolase
VRRAVRGQLGLGAKAIKMMASGLLGGELGGQDPQFSPEELRAGIEEAHLQSRHAFVHAHGTRGCRNAVLAGVDSIDHGTFLDEEVVGLMARGGTFLVPTLSFWARMEAHQEDESVPSVMRAAYKKTGKGQYASHRQSVRLALEGGVRIAMGTDAGELPHDRGAFELEALVDAGLSPMQAIVAATSHGADLLRLKDIGRLEEGRIADLVVVRGDPLSDIRVLQDTERIGLVLKGGTVCCDRFDEERPCSTS